MPYRLSQRAELNLLQIFEDGYERFGINQAIKYRDDLLKTLELLSEFPDLARKREEFKQSVRAYPYGSHIILLVVRDEGLIVASIRHGREDWQGDLN